MEAQQPTDTKSIPQLVLELIAAHPGITLADLAKALPQKPRSAISSALYFWDKKEKIAHEEGKGGRKYYPAPSVKTAATEPPAPAAHPASESILGQAQPHPAVVYKEAPQFRVALTSDATLMLIGLTPSVIELTPEQTAKVVDFCSALGTGPFVGSAK